VPAATHPVPADVEANTLAELIADCRGMVAGALPSVRRVVDLTRLPTQRGPAIARGVVIDIRDHVVALVDGASDYGA
jgi:hypothetical protein